MTTKSLCHFRRVNSDGPPSSSSCVQKHVDLGAYCYLDLTIWHLVTFVTDLYFSPSHTLSVSVVLSAHGWTRKLRVQAHHRRNSRIWFITTSCWHRHRLPVDLETRPVFFLFSVLVWWVGCTRGSSSNYSLLNPYHCCPVETIICSLPNVCFWPLGCFTLRGRVMLLCHAAVMHHNSARLYQDAVLFFMWVWCCLHVSVWELLTEHESWANSWEHLWGGCGITNTSHRTSRLVATTHVSLSLSGNL